MIATLLLNRGVRFVTKDYLEGSAPAGKPCGFFRGLTP